MHDMAGAVGRNLPRLFPEHPATAELLTLELTVRDRETIEELTNTPAGAERDELARKPPEAGQDRPAPK